MSILTRVQSNPEIGSDNSGFVQELITRAENFVRMFCKLPSFPEDVAGSLVSGTSPSTNISGIDSNTFWIGCNGSSLTQVSISLADCTSGATTASALQTAIRAASTEYGFDEVTVGYASSLYTVTSGRVGEGSSIDIQFLDETQKHLCQALKLSPEYGATSYRGNRAVPALEDAVVMLVEQKYRQIGLEGLSGGAIPGGVSFSATAIDPFVLNVLLAHRRF